MQNRRNRVLGLLLVVSMGPTHAATPAIGFFGEIHGSAYWQNDSSKKPVRDLDELGENSKLVLQKGSKLTVLYLKSGQQYELVGPARAVQNPAADCLEWRATKKTRYGVGD